MADATGLGDTNVGEDPPAAGAGTLSVRAWRQQNGGVVPPPHRRRGRRAPWSRQDRERWACRAVVAVAAVAGALTEVAPTGDRIADRVLTAGWVALVAAAASTARRWTWYVFAGVGLAAAADQFAVACAATALALALLSSRPVRPHPAVGAAIGGLGAVALLDAEDPAGHGSSAALAALAAALVLVSGYRHAGRSARHRARIGLVAAGAAVAVVGTAYGAAALAARPAAERGLDRLERGLAASRHGDDAAAASHLDAAADAFADAERNLGGLLAAPARALPIVGQNARAAESMAAAAADVAREGATAATDADVDTLVLRGGALDLAHIGSLAGPLDEVAAELDRASDRLAAEDTAWLVPPVADRLDEVRAELTTAHPDVELAADATRLVPAMFGGARPTRWFVAFVTPVEARGRTGFLGNFAELTATDGKVEMTRFGRASELEAGGTPGPERSLSGPDDYLARWARFEPQSTWRNITMSPDFPSIGQVVAELYPQSGGQPVDGVIAVDPVGLAALLRLTGPIGVPDVADPLTPDNAAAFLLRDQYLALPETTRRVDALESLARAAFDRLTTGDLPGPRTVSKSLSAAAAGGHLHAYAVDSAQQALFEDLGVDGALPPTRGGDYVGVVTNNAVGNKVDLFLTRQLTYDVAWDPATGTLDATATVTLTNEAPASGLPGTVIGTPLRGDEAPPPGTNRSYLSVYSPWGVDAARLDGQPVNVERQREGDRYAYSLFLDVPPEGGTRTLELHMLGRLATTDEYRLVVGTQPLVTPDQFTLTVDSGEAELAAWAGGSESGAGAVQVDGHTARASGPLVDEATAYRIQAGS
jgi:Protein of unknown function (DUF4012)